MHARSNKYSKADFSTQNGYKEKTAPTKCLRFLFLFITMRSIIREIFLKKEEENKNSSPWYQNLHHEVHKRKLKPSSDHVQHRQIHQHQKKHPTYIQFYVIHLDAYHPFVYLDQTVNPLLMRHNLFCLIS